MTALEQRVLRLEHAHDANTSAFSDGIKVLEIQQRVAFRVLEDVYNGKVRVLDVSSDDEGHTVARVDVDGYIKDHLAALTQIEERPATAPEPLIASPDDDAPIIFGGDHQR